MKHLLRRNLLIAVMMVAFAFTPFSVKAAPAAAVLNPQTAQDVSATPTAPVLFAVDAISASQLKIQWFPAANATVDSYRIEHSDNAAGPFTAVTSIDGELSLFVHDGLTPNSTHFYRIIAINGSGEGSPSNVVSGTTRDQSLPTPQNMTATLLEGGEIMVNWNGAPTNVLAILEVAATNLEGYQFVGGTSGNGPFIFTPTQDSAYSFRVKFLQGNNESDYAYTSQNVVVGSVTNTRVYLPALQR